MTHPSPLTPESAAQAQRTLEPGAGRCVLCGERIWRFLTSGDTQHLTMFDEVEDGAWDFPGGLAEASPDPRMWIATRPGIGRGNLAPHNCLQDGAP